MNTARNHKIYVIAEIGSNHNGDFAKAREMVSAAKEAGADAVKFQTYIPEKLCHSSQAPLPILKDRYKNQQERFRELTFTEPQYRELKALADKLGIDFASSPFDIESALMLEPLVSFYKIASGDINNVQLIDRVARTGKSVLISTGMSTLEEVDRIYQSVDHNKLAILHCVSLYPADGDKLNLMTIPFLKERYPDIAIGYSDHHPGIDACLYAAVLGAQIIEKHFTFDKSICYGDHALSADYRDMRRMAREIKAISGMLGQKDFRHGEEELQNRRFFRRGLYTARELNAGEKIRPSDIVPLRPPASINIYEIEKVIGMTVKRPLEKETPISWEDLE